MKSRPCPAGGEVPGGEVRGDLYKLFNLRRKLRKGQLLITHALLGHYHAERCTRHGSAARGHTARGRPIVPIIV